MTYLWYMEEWHEPGLQTVFQSHRRKYPEGVLRASSYHQSCQQLDPSYSEEINRQWSLYEIQSFPKLLLAEFVYWACPTLEVEQFIVSLRDISTLKVKIRLIYSSSSWPITRVWNPEFFWIPQDHNHNLIPKF